MTRDPLVAELARIVGPAHVLVDPDVRAPYERDWTGRWQGRTRAVARPGDTAAVAAVVRACADHGVDLVPQGGNTGLVGGSVPADGAVVLSLTRLGALEPVDRLARQVTVGAGVTLARLQAHAAASGLAYGVDLAARDTATVGGTIATNAGGIHVVAHGPTRDQVQGLEAVLADGQVVRRLTGLAKDTVGYDLPQLLVGSEGTLAVVTRARLRLVPAPRHRLVAAFGLDDTASAVTVAAELRDRLPGLVAVEYLERPGVELAAATSGVPAPFGTTPAVLLIIEVAGPDDPTEAVAAALDDLRGVGDVAVASDGPARGRLWRVREAQTEAIATRGGAHKLEVTLPLPRLASFRRDLDELVATSPVRELHVFGHLAEGNLHVNLVGEVPATLEAAVLRRVVDHGGSISSEHGIGRHKAPYLTMARDAADVAAMRAIKRALDPAGRLNPGVLFATG